MALEKKKQRVFVIGDIHGAFRALQQCLERSGFDAQNDHLICLGDVADGWPETRAAVDALLRIQNLTLVLGNHDWWTLQWMLTGIQDPMWQIQGGRATIDSYRDGIPDDHISFFLNADDYHLRDSRLFVHAGLDLNAPLEEQEKNTFLWDRSLASLALDSYGNGSLENISIPFEEIYLGHTTIPFHKPINSSGIWLMDTGAGWSGVLSMMNIETKEMFISDAVPSLYPGIVGRTKSE